MRISSGKSASGQGGASIPSIAGGAAAILRSAKLAMSSLIGFGGPSKEWCAVFGTVGAALDGLTFAGFDGNDDAGKCFFLYILST